MEFTYESVNNALNAHHYNLSGYWESMGWDEEKAWVTYTLEDGSEEEAFIDKEGNVTASEALIKDMESIG